MVSVVRVTTVEKPVVVMVPDACTGMYRVDPVDVFLTLMVIASGVVPAKSSVAIPEAFVSSRMIWELSLNGPAASCTYTWAFSIGFPEVSKTVTVTGTDATTVVVDPAVFRMVGIVAPVLTLMVTVVPLLFRIVA